MFDFEKLEVYRKAKKFNGEINILLKKNSINRISHNQLYRASLSIVINIAEGSGRFSKADKRNFYIIARSSLFESIAILDVLKGENQISERSFQDFHSMAEVLSKILYSMIKNLEKK